MTASLALGAGAQARDFLSYRASPVREDGDSSCKVTSAYSTAALAHRLDSGSLELRVPKIPKAGGKVRTATANPHQPVATPLTHPEQGREDQSGRSV